MAFPSIQGSEFRAATSTTIILSQPVLSLKEICEKLQSVEALQIERIGTRLIDQVMDNLGPIQKAKVAQEVLKKTKADSLDPRAPTIYRVMLMLAQSARETGEAKFFSDENRARFSLAALEPVKKAISNALSTPQFFLESGVEFILSDYDPEGFIAETAKEIGIKLTFIDVPQKYRVGLRLDQDLTVEKSELVFSLVQQSDGVVFSKTTFSLPPL